MAILYPKENNQEVSFTIWCIDLCALDADFRRREPLERHSLLDETEVFVEQRATSDIYRNAFVCVSLRKLEYYTGILILTTNRVKTIDEAVASRIHLPLRYDNLEQTAQMKVWKIFLEKFSAVKGVASLTSKDLERLVKKDLNGQEVRISHLGMAPLIVRQIKNAVLTAQALAGEEDGRIRFPHLENAIAFNAAYGLCRYSRA